MILLLSALALGRMSFVVNDWEKQQRKIHKAQKGTVKPSTKRKAG